MDQNRNSEEDNINDLVAKHDAAMTKLGGIYEKSPKKQEASNIASDNPDLDSVSETVSYARRIVEDIKKEYIGMLRVLSSQREEIGELQQHKKALIIKKSECDSQNADLIKENDVLRKSLALSDSAKNMTGELLNKSKETLQQKEQELVSVTESHKKAAAPLVTLLDRHLKELEAKQAQFGRSSRRLETSLDAPSSMRSAGPGAVGVAKGQMLYRELLLTRRQLAFTRRELAQRNASETEAASRQLLAQQVAELRMEGAVQAHLLQKARQALPRLRDAFVSKTEELQGELLRKNRTLASLQEQFVLMRAELTTAAAWRQRATEQGRMRRQAEESMAVVQKQRLVILHENAEQVQRARHDADATRNGQLRALHLERALAEMRMNDLRLRNHQAAANQRGWLMATAGLRNHAVLAKQNANMVALRALLQKSEDKRQELTIWNDTAETTEKALTRQIRWLIGIRVVGLGITFLTLLALLLASGVL